MPAVFRDTLRLPREHVIQRSHQVKSPFRSGHLGNPLASGSAVMCAEVATRRAIVSKGITDFIVVGEFIGKANLKRENSAGTRSLL